MKPKTQNLFQMLEELPDDYYLEFHLTSIPSGYRGISMNLVDRSKEKDGELRWLGGIVTKAGSPEFVVHCAHKIQEVINESKAPNKSRKVSQ